MCNLKVPTPTGNNELLSLVKKKPTQKTRWLGIAAALESLQSNVLLADYK